MTSLTLISGQIATIENISNNRFIFFLKFSWGKCINFSISHLDMININFMFRSISYIKLIMKKKEKCFDKLDIIIFFLIFKDNIIFLYYFVDSLCIVGFI